MSVFVGISIAAFVLFAYAHLVGALIFETWLRRQPRSLEQELGTLSSFNSEGAASVAILVCSRGRAPQTESMLAALLQQDYPNYHVYFVVDQSDDGNWEQLQQWKTAHDLHSKLTLMTLSNVRLTCGLKCSALLTALQALPTSIQYIALIDCDVIPRPDWLSQLIRPLQKTEIGVVTGGQWYEPASAWDISTMVRSLWNAGAIVPTWMLANPWAGSLSMRLQDLADSGLTDQWGLSVVDDGPVRGCIGRIYREIWFSPHLIAVNQESCSWSFVVNYITRMLTWSRWYEATFVNTAIHALVTAAVWVLWLLALGTALLTANLAAMVALIIALLFSGVVMVTSYLFVRGAVYRAIEQPIPALPWRFYIWAPGAIAVTQVVFCLAVLLAIFKKRITWRQATYVIHGPQRVRLEKYLPYRASGVTRADSQRHDSI